MRGSVVLCMVWDLSACVNLKVGFLAFFVGGGYGIDLGC